MIMTSEFVKLIEMKLRLKDVWNVNLIRYGYYDVST